MKILTTNTIATAILCVMGIPSGISAMRLFRLLKPSKPRLAHAAPSAAHDLLIPLFPWLLMLFAWNKLPKSYMMGFFFGFMTGMRLSVIGLTGSIASGKSTASHYLQSKLGYKVIDADKIARVVLDKGTSGYNAVVKTFGTAIIDPESGQINRLKLGAIVFADPSRRRVLESITHPRIVFRIIWDVIRLRLIGHKVVMDVPLLFESRSPFLRFLCRERFLIDVDTDIQRRRIRERNPGMSEIQIEDRIKSQMPREEKLKLADYVIENNGTMDEFYARLDRYFR